MHTSSRRFGREIDWRTAATSTFSPPKRPRAILRQHTRTISGMQAGVRGPVAFAFPRGRRRRGRLICTRRRWNHKQRRSAASTCDTHTGLVCPQRKFNTWKLAAFARDFISLVPGSSTVNKPEATENEKLNMNLICGSGREWVVEMETSFCVCWFRNRALPLQSFSLENYEKALFQSDCFSF